MRCRSGALRAGTIDSNNRLYLSLSPKPFRPVYGRCPAAADQRPCQPCGALSHPVGGRQHEPWPFSAKKFRDVPPPFAHTPNRNRLKCYGCGVSKLRASIDHGPTPCALYGQYLLWDSDSPRPLGRALLLHLLIFLCHQETASFRSFGWMMRHKCRMDRASPVCEKTFRNKYSGFLTAPCVVQLPPVADNFKFFTYGGSKS